MKKYTPLHIHSHFSLLQGLAKPAQIAQRCSGLGISSCALTDNGTISGAVQFYQKMTAAKIKPILGCQLYIAHNDSKIKTKENVQLSNFIVLAKNYQGWKNLIKIVSASNDQDRFYNKPRISINELADYLDGNLIGYCGHLGSYLSDLIKNKDATESKNIAVNFVSKMKEIFGQNNFFLESQLMDQENIVEQKDLTDFMRNLGAVTNTKVIGTPDAHYCRKEDSVDQRILLCNNLKMTLASVNKKILNNEEIAFGSFFKSENYHILSPEEMSAIHTQEEIENTNYVDSLCEEYSILNRPMLPEFKCPKGYNPDEYLRELCRTGWRDKIANVIPKEKHQEYVDRVKNELEVLQGAGLSSYFLIVQDIVNFVRKNNWLPGNGRGSAAGCLVSYLIGITGIDPIKYDLLFERFFNAARSDAMPDIDVDVPINKRENIIQYIKDTYGHDKVSQMITFNTMKGRGALKEVLRVYDNVSFEEMNRITKHIPDEAKIADELQEMREETGESSIIRWALENNVDKLKDWCYINDDGSFSGPMSKRFEQAIRLEGTKSNQSKHAAGVAISSQSLSEVCPMIYDSKNDQKIAGMEMQDLESLGVIKLDVLGIALLDKVMNISDILRNGDDNG